MKPSAVLRWSIEYFEQPRNEVCRGLYWQVDLNGRVYACSPEAATCLAEGAPGNGYEANTYLRRVLPAGSNGPRDWASQDGRTKAEVIALFEKAEALALSEGQ